MSQDLENIVSAAKMLLHRLETRAAPSPQGRPSAQDRVAPVLRVGLRLTTPTFLGGVTPRQPDPILPLRPASLKGVMRYWLRAVLSDLIRPLKQDSPSSRQRMLENMKEVEGLLMGDTQRAGCFSLQVSTTGSSVPYYRESPSQRQSPGLRYMGYGIFEQPNATGLHPDAPPFEITLRVTPPKPLTRWQAEDRKDEQDRREEARKKGLISFRDDTAPSGPELAAVGTALLLLASTFGGLGARSRRGFGSFRLVSLDTTAPVPSCVLRQASDGTDYVLEHGLVWHTSALRAMDITPLALLTPVRQVSELRGRLEQTLKYARRVLRLFLNDHVQGLSDVKELLPHPAVLSFAGLKDVRIPDVTFPTPVEALEAAGRCFQDFRSTIRRSERKAPLLQDYFEIKEFLKTGRPPANVARAFFGLPLPFFFRSLNGAKVTLRPKLRAVSKRSEGTSADRLASPLHGPNHAKIHQFTLIGGGCEGAGLDDTGNAPLLGGDGPIDINAGVGL